MSKLDTSGQEVSRPMALKAYFTRNSWFFFILFDFLFDLLCTLSKPAPLWPLDKD